MRWHAVLIATLLAMVTSKKFKGHYPGITVLAVASGRAVDACPPADGQVSRRHVPRAAAGLLPRLWSGHGDGTAVAHDGVCPQLGAPRTLPAPAWTANHLAELH